MIKIRDCCKKYSNWRNFNTELVDNRRETIYLCYNDDMGKKNFKLVFYYIILMVICQVVGVGGQVFAEVNDFYFSDFTGDYYLSKDMEGISHLKVKESVTAEFPEFNQNKGICRQIPFTNQNGANVTLPRLTKDDITVTRNGDLEPIYSIRKEDNYYNVCTGTDEYVLGTQTYVFEYEFTKVITDFEDYQELYWDTNGNGASQRFDKVTARVHFDNKANWADKAWCYVGKYGEKGQERCKITETKDGVEFMAENLGPHENLTFDVEMMPKVFIVPGPVKNYVYVWLTVGAGVLCALAIGFGVRKFIRTREKANYYKGIFVKPEYQPSKDYSLPEMAEVYLGKKKDMKVAMLLELVVKRKIEFKKADKKKWTIIVKDLDGVGEEYMKLLLILDGGTKLEVGDEIELKRRTATSWLISLRRSMEKIIVENLKKDKLVEAKYKFGGSSKRGVANVVVMSIIMIPTVVALGIFVMGVLDGMLGLDELYGQEMVFYAAFYPTVFVMIAVTVPVVVALSDASQKYEEHTKEGLRASRYMDGLRLYIEMAEAERMKMLQSVKGADTSVEGIVKLYEKLLPYAAVFGLEESWMKEMKDYCEVKEIETPDYLMQGIVTSEMMRAVNTASSYATTATRMQSSGGGASSGFSGGGGGGFSGGGGGGGGFGGR